MPFIRGKLPNLRSVTDPQPEPYERCFKCSKEQANLTAPLAKCTKCRYALYCSKTCQKKDWAAHEWWCFPQMANPRPFSLETQRASASASAAAIESTSRGDINLALGRRGQGGIESERSSSNSSLKLDLPASRRYTPYARPGPSIVSSSLTTVTDRNRVLNASNGISVSSSNDLSTGAIRPRRPLDNPIIRETVIPRMLEEARLPPDSYDRYQNGEFGPIDSSFDSESSYNVFEDMTPHRANGLLIDSFRLRNADEAEFRGKREGIYAIPKPESPEPLFKAFLDSFEQSDLLPNWWGKRNRKECEKVAMDREKVGGYIIKSIRERCWRSMKAKAQR